MGPDSKSSARGSIAASAEGFYIADETALPLWQTPVGVFSVGETDPERELLTVLAPPDFRVLAPGKPLKRRKSLRRETWRRTGFPHSAGQGFSALCGRRPLPGIGHPRAARHSELSGRSGRSIRKPRKRRPRGSPPPCARWRIFLVPHPKRKTSVHIVEAPGDLPIEFGDLESLQPEGRHASPEMLGAIADPALGGNSFPEGALLDSRAIAQGVADEAVLQLAEYELARTWFGWRVRPTPEAQILMGRGVGLFGLVIAAEARGPDQRRRMVASLLERYDQARAIAPDKRLMEPPFGYSRAERISTGYRAALFLVELEDLCGHDPLRAAFRAHRSCPRGDEAGYEELRAAAESASGRDLADVFRHWLIQPGVPDEFRGRYARRVNARPDFRTDSMHYAFTKLNTRRIA